MKNLPNYDIQTTIYESANSIVYRGIKKENNQVVILKTLKEDYPLPAELTRYQQEYEMVRRLAHLDGIINTCGLEKYQNTLMICLEDFGGESLKHWKSKRTFTLEELLTLAINAANILGQIHQQHIIHKDINPANLVFNPTTGVLKVIDFGISTQLSRQHLTLKNPNVLEGTLSYMSPEQTGRMNRTLDYRTDFYSLGATFYELFTGQLPFETTDAMELVHYHIAKQAVPPIQINPDIPQSVSDIIMKLLAKTAEERYQSAWGIKADLEKCKAYLAQDQYEPFILAQQDISAQFQIPQKLYGREQEVNRLLQTFERIVNPNQSPIIQREIILVTGYSGIGKSLLVKEIYKSLAEKKGYFISGKFDQFQRNIPYSAIVNAFGELVQQLLTESDAQLQTWKEKLLTALGPNGQVIIDVIPEVQLMIGPQSPVPTLGATESQNRFNLVFQNFMRVFCQPTHPLVLFLDDLQWADSATLNLLEVVLTDRETKALFFIGAYRDNEVDSTHPLVMTLDTLRQENLSINQINLTPLTFEHINQLIADSLHQPTKKVASLTELVMRKTGGNPFFVTQFLHTLYEEELLTFNTAERLKTSKVSQSGWQWEIEQIEALDITDNVVDLMIGKLKKLPDSAQHALRLAACVGNHFNLEMLSLIAEKSTSETFQHLEPVMMEGLILPLSEPEISEDNIHSTSFEHYKLSDSVAPITINHFRFLHDRVQQAAYALIDEDHKKVLHLKIGRLLLKNTSADQLEKNIFDIVEHLNLGYELINHSVEKTELTRLNLKAGQKAKAATAYGAAVQYLDLGLSYLAQDSWETEYKLTLNLHIEAMEAKYLNTHYEQTEKLAEIVLQNTKNLLDKVKVYDIQIQTYIAQNQPWEAVKTALFVLESLGYKFTAQPSQADIAAALQQTESLLGKKSPQQLLELPAMTDPIKLTVMRIIFKVIRPTYYSCAELGLLFVLEKVNLSIQYGNAPESSIAYAYYGSILCQIVGDIEVGYQFGELALALLEHLESQSVKAGTYFLVSLIIKHWKVHTRETLQPLMVAYQTGLETGYLSFTTDAAYAYSFHLYIVGWELIDLEKKMVIYGDAIAKFKQQTHLNFQRMFHQSVLNLLGHAENPCDLKGKYYNETEMLPRHIEAQDSTGLCILYVNKLILSYLFLDYSQALENIAQIEKYLENVRGTTQFTLFCFYNSLTKLAIFPELSTQKQATILKNLETSQEKFKTWAEHAPMNYWHKFHLIEAEKARVLGQFIEAEMSYEKAIQGAKDNEYLQEEAMAYELAARFYLGRGMEKFAQTYFREAHYCYQQWGAIAKVTDLEERYPQFLAHQTSSAFESDVTDVSVTRIVSSKSTNNDSQWLDLNTMMKASQALSGEIVLSRLLEKMMQIVIENAGAEKGLLLLPKDNNWFIEAECDVNSEEIKVLQEILVSGPEVPLVRGGIREILIPANIIHYIARTQESIVLHDAIQEGIFTRDPYIVHKKPQSILGMPLITQGKLTGILYLENNLTTGAFTADRLEVLKLLSSQMAISIENAKLYANVRDNENRLRQFLEAIPIGVFVINTEAQPYFINQTGQQILGKGVISEKEPESLPAVYQTYLKGTEQIYPFEHQPIIRALQGERVMIDDMEIHQGEQRIPLEVWGRPIFDEQEKITYAIATFQDISERLQREKAEREREAAEAVNEAIMESIQYAKLIQSSLLPNIEQVKTYLPNSFFLWMPRDIVGGDMFYTEAFDDGFIVAVMDCTGHGVPGAFMTMIATTSLRRIIKDEGCHEPSDILKQLNFSVKTALQQETEYARSDDGLDAAICWVKPQENILSFAGAKLPLYYIQNEQLTIIKGDKKSLGYKKSDLAFTFTSHTLPFEKGMSFYLTTDGFLDQLGGPKRFSFGKKRFKKLLLDVERYSFDEQAEKLLDAFNDYKGDNNRQDDVTVVGFGF